MKEQLITFKTAKLAKEKGFTEHSTDRAYINYYSKDFVGEKKYNLKIYHENVYNGNNPIYLAPTQSLLQRWLRETYSLHIIIIPTITFDFTFKIINIQSNPENKVELPPYTKVHSMDYSTYEEALKEALYESLKLI